MSYREFFFGFVFCFSITQTFSLGIYDSDFRGSATLQESDELVSIPMDLSEIRILSFWLSGNVMEWATKDVQGLLKLTIYDEKDSFVLYWDLSQGTSRNNVIINSEIRQDNSVLNIEVIEPIFVDSNLETISIAWTEYAYKTHGFIRMYPKRENREGALNPGPYPHRP